VTTSLTISARFVLQTYHGAGRPDRLLDWPPSPFRLYQALTRSALEAVPEGDERDRRLAALRWLECLPPPVILAPVAREACGRVAAGPNNDGDRLMASAARGATITTNDEAAEKTLLRIPEATFADVPVSWRWEAEAPSPEIIEVISEAVTGITCIGRGTDLTICRAEWGTPPPTDRSRVRWLPTDRRRGNDWLRVPIDGSIEALEARHREKLQVVRGASVHPVGSLSSGFREVVYVRSTLHTPPEFSLWDLMLPGSGGTRRASFTPSLYSSRLAANLRHALGQAAMAAGWPDELVRVGVHGHRHGDSDAKGITSLDGNRIGIVAAPTRTHYDGQVKVDVIRRMMLWCPDPDLHRLAANLVPGLILRDMNSEDALAELREPMAGDSHRRQYSSPSKTWATVTPMAVPEGRTERMVRLELGFAGLPRDLVSEAEIETMVDPFVVGAEHASQYRAPSKVGGRLVHCRITFPEPVSGPIIAGGGRFRGIGLFAPA